MKAFSGSVEAAFGDHVCPLLCEGADSRQVQVRGGVQSHATHVGYAHTQNGPWWATRDEQQHRGVQAKWGQCLSLSRKPRTPVTMKGVQKNHRKWKGSSQLDFKLSSMNEPHVIIGSDAVCNLLSFCLLEFRSHDLMSTRWIQKLALILRAQRGARPPRASLLDTHLSVCPSRATQRDQDGEREVGRQRERHWSEWLLLLVTQHHQDPLHQTDPVLGTRKLPKAHISRLRFNPVFFFLLLGDHGSIIITPRPPPLTEMNSITFFRFPPWAAEPPSRGATGQTPAFSRPGVHPLTGGHLRSGPPTETWTQAFVMTVRNARATAALRLRWGRRCVSETQVQCTHRCPLPECVGAPAWQPWNSTPGLPPGPIRTESVCFDFVCFI